LAGGAFVEEEVWLQVVGVLGLGKDLLRIKGVVARLLENGEDQAQERGVFVEGRPFFQRSKRSKRSGRSGIQPSLYLRAWGAFLGCGIFPELNVRIFRYTEGMTIPLSLSRRGQITLPKEVREKLGLRPGDVLLLKVEEGRLVLEPALLLSYEVYSEERLEEFRKAAEATPEEVAAFLEAWGLE
jgi:antitoxin PrlF